MPVSIDKVGGKYRVSTPHGVKAKGTSLAKAKSQERLLNAVDHGWKPTHQNEGVNQIKALIAEAGHKAGCTCGFCKNKGSFGKKKEKPDEKDEPKEPPMSEAMGNMNWRVRVKHDKGHANIRTHASSEAGAREIVKKSEGCPDGAIKSVKRTKPSKFTSEGRDDINSLPMSSAAKHYARRSGLASMKKQPQQYINMVAADTNQKGKQHGFRNSDAEEMSSGGRMGSSNIVTKKKGYGSESKAQAVVDRMLG